jgi:predicted flap endonuclease-1-like 5' DNA nuclease
MGGTSAGRKDVAAKAGISDKLILEWVNHVDLFRIKGVGEEYADLLEEAGVDTVVELAQRRADNLLSKMTEVNDSKNLVNKMPALSQVEDWVAQAKKLPRAVSY